MERLVEFKISVPVDAAVIAQSVFFSFRCLSNFIKTSGRRKYRKLSNIDCKITNACMKYQCSYCILLIQLLALCCFLIYRWCIIRYQGSSRLDCKQQTYTRHASSPRDRQAARQWVDVLGPGCLPFGEDTRGRQGIHWEWEMHSCADALAASCSQNPLQVVWIETLAGHKRTPLRPASPSPVCTGSGCSRAPRQPIRRIRWLRGELLSWHNWPVEHWHRVIVRDMKNTSIHIHTQGYLPPPPPPIACTLSPNQSFNLLSYLGKFNILSLSLSLSLSFRSFESGKKITYQRKNLQCSFNKATAAIS